MAFNVALFVLRVGAGLLMMNHGYTKLVKFGTLKQSFMNFAGLGSATSLSLVIFAEFFCSILIILGLFTRLAAVPLIIMLSVIHLKVTQGQFFGDGELPSLFLLCFLTIFLVGPGRASVDSMITE